MKISGDVSVKYIEACKRLNEYIENDLNLEKSYQIGHAYFMKIKLETESNNIKEDNLRDLWSKNIEPLLREYLRTKYQSNDL